MTHFQVIVSTTSGACALLALVLGLVFRITQKWTRVEDKLEQLMGDVSDLVEQKEEAHKKLYDEMREDRKATNERLTYLERNVWPPKKNGK